MHTNWCSNCAESSHTSASACATKAWVWVLDDPRAAVVVVLPGWWFWATTLAAAVIWPVEGGLWLAYMPSLASMAAMRAPISSFQVSISARRRVCEAV